MNTISTRLALSLLAVLIIMLLAVPSAALADGGEWTWMSGADTVNQSGIYGVQGTPDPANVPGARRNSISWIDGAGNLWLFWWRWQRGLAERSMALRLQRALDLDEWRKHSIPGRRLRRQGRA